MSIEKVHGLKVVSTSRVPTPLNPVRRGGEETNHYYRKVELLHLEDGTQVYGCTHTDCTYVGDSAMAIAAGHWNKEHKVHADTRWETFKNWSLHEIVEYVAEAEDAIDDITERLEATVAANRILKAENKRLEKEMDGLQTAARRLLGRGDK